MPNKKSRSVRQNFLWHATPVLNALSKGVSEDCGNVSTGTPVHLHYDKSTQVILIIYALHLDRAALARAYLPEH